MPVNFGDGALLDDDIDGDDDSLPVNFGDGAFDDLGDGAMGGVTFDV